MKDLLEEPAFVVGARTYTWRDVLTAAILRGDWSNLEQQTREGLALVAQADEEGTRPSEEAIEAAGQEFRYERELITAEEMEAWLARFDITVDDWMDYVERSLLRQSGRAADAADEEQSEQDDIAGVMVAEAACSGALADFARKLAGRAAIAERAAAEKLEAGSPSLEDLSAARSEVAAAFERLEIVPPTEETVSELARLELAFEAYSRRLATPAAVAAQIEAHRLDWIRLDVFSLSFQEESAAREAWLCLEEDGVSLQEVAASAHVPVERAQLYLSELDAAARPSLLSARPGELVGPLAFGDRFHLFLLHDKFSPSRENPEVRRRAEEALAQKVVDQELSARVRWQAPV